MFIFLLFKSTNPNVDQDQLEPNRIFPKFEKFKLKTKTQPSKSNLNTNLNEVLINRVEIISLPSFNLLNDHSKQEKTSTRQNIEKTTLLQPKQNNFTPTKKVTFNTQVAQPEKLNADAHKRYSSSYLDCANNNNSNNKPITSSQLRSSLLNRSKLKEKVEVYSSSFDFKHSNYLENDVLEKKSSPTNLLKDEQEPLKLSKLSGRLESVREALPLGENICIRHLSLINANNSKQAVSQKIK